MSPASFLQRPSPLAGSDLALQSHDERRTQLRLRVVRSQDHGRGRRGARLSCWSVAFNGAEPVRSETLDRFVSRFGPCGFQRAAFNPGYGLAKRL